MRKRHVFKTGTAMLLAAAMMITSVPANVTAAEAVSEDNLIASYVFSDEDVTDKVIEDASGNGNDADLKGINADISNGILTLPGGSHAATSNANSPAYVELPGDMFEGQDTLTITTWLKNQTGSDNYCAMFFGTKTKHVDSSKDNNYPLNYWLLNPKEKDKGGMFKSVWTNSDNAGAPYTTETPVSATSTSSDWGLYTTVITPNSITGYYNGVEVCSSSKSKTTTDFGTDLVAYIGRSGYADIFYKGGVYGVKVYNTAWERADVLNEYYTNVPYGADKDTIINTALSADSAEINLGDISAVKKDIELPSTGNRGSKITWSSDMPEVIANDGTVVRDSAVDKTVTLTATLEIEGITKEKTFSVTVVAATTEALYEEYQNEKENFAVPAMVEADFVLPNTFGENSEISWSSSDETVLALTEMESFVQAAVKRSSEDVQVTLTADVAYDDGTNSDADKMTMTVTVRAVDYGYLMSYTNSTESTALGNSLHLAYSEDGVDYTALNSNTGICFANNKGGSKNSSPNALKNLYVFRKADGTYGMIATNVSTQKYIYVFDSPDLVDFSNERKLTLNYNVTGDLKVELSKNKADESVYKIFWTDGNKQYSALTKDFKTVSAQGEDGYTVEKAAVEGKLPEGAVIGNVFGVSQSEYQFVVNKLGIVKNTGMKKVAVTAKAGADVSKLLPAKVTAEYNDGTTKDMHVDWNMTDIAKVDLTKNGVYTVSGTVEQIQYANSFIPQRADPCILKGNDGYYYFTASYPMCGYDKTKDGYDRVVLRRSKSIAGLADAEEVTIWHYTDTDNEYRFIWAPEIRLVNGEYYVYYTSSVNDSDSNWDNRWGIRPHVLKCTNSEDIMNKASWQPMGVMQAVETDNLAFTGFSLDMTVFENQGRWYAVWAQTVGFSSLLIAEIDPEEPWKCISESAVITVPEYSWERINENVNEGPSIIKNDGKIYMAFSASATGPEYCIGLLSIDEDEDMLDATAWKKQAYPVLTSSDVPGEYGPGHNSFTVDEEGNPIFVYHARGEECYNNQCAWANEDPLVDPCRDARLKRVHFAADGTPILKMSYEEELAPENRVVTATVTVVGNSEPSADGGVENGGATDDGKTDNITPNTGATDTNTQKEETTITLSETKISMGLKEKNVKLTADVKGPAKGQTITWTSSNTKVATVKDGKVTASKNKTGKTIITATTADGKTATCEVNVKKAPKSLTLNKKSVTLKLKKNKTFQIKVKKYKPSNAASYKLTYKSSKKKVATVSKTGLVTAKKAGTAKITVKTYNGKTAKITIKVKK